MTKTSISKILIPSPHPPPSLPLEGGEIKKVPPKIPSLSKGGLGRC